MRTSKKASGSMRDVDESYSSDEESDPADDSYGSGNSADNCADKADMSAKHEETKGNSKPLWVDEGPNPAPIQCPDCSAVIGGLRPLRGMA